MVVFLIWGHRRSLRIYREVFVRIWTGVDGRRRKAPMSNWNCFDRKPLGPKRAENLCHVRQIKGFFGGLISWPYRRYPKVHGARGPEIDRVCVCINSDDSASLWKPDGTSANGFGGLRLAQEHTQINIPMDISKNSPIEREAVLNASLLRSARQLLDDSIHNS